MMNLSAVVRLTGVNENTLRAWERRYGAVTPARTENGRRSYSPKDVERIKILWALVAEGHSIGLIAQQPTAKLKTMLSESLSPMAAEVAPSSGKAEKFLSDLIRALDEFNLEHLHYQLQRARFELSTKEVIFDLVQPLLRKVGEQTELGKLSITQEHLLSSLLRDYLGNIHQSLGPYDFATRSKSKTIVITTREGDVHEFNILLGAILSNIYQFQTYYLGPNMPVEDLINFCAMIKADYLILGFTPLPLGRELVAPQAYVSKLDKALPRKITFCCGGIEEAALKRISTEREIVALEGLSHLDRYLASKSQL